ncbi:MAG: PAS domain-containing protein [Opitutaceae bacterium]|nr:PAS domain-containing protein [Opitutaceae bacterium]
MNTMPPHAVPLPLDRDVVAAFLDQVPDLVYFKDRESRFIAVSRSKARRHGLEPRDLVGRSDADFFSAEHASFARRCEEQIMVSGEPIVGRTEQITWPDGRESWVITTKLPLRDETGAIIGTFGLTKDVTDKHRLQQQLESAQRRLVEASRLAGMAEVATGVLHNVGNVLTSVNVSASVLAASARRGKTEAIGQLASLLRQHAASGVDEARLRRLPELLTSLAASAIEERQAMLRELASLQENIDHIKDIVTMQQAYAKMAGAVEPLDAAALMADALRMNAGALQRHRVVCDSDFQPTPPVLGEKGKILQILVNLIRNAKYAADDGPAHEKRITLRVAPLGADRVRLAVEDNGVGIAPENLSKIFTHGFTTRATGHGFGLHSSLAAAHELRGSLTVHSEGPGRGACFTLELPAAVVAAKAA